jgi:hypothetical protein
VVAAAAPAAAPKVLGVASCAAMACHHANGTLGSKGSEYSTWVAIDPHARAYRTLFNDRSVRMQELLDPRIKAHENALCLKCHAIEASAGVPRAFRGDGVGCESCHGPAEHWKATHYLPGFDRMTPGFIDTRDLAVRAEACARCHVGGPGGQEVNHDLIAAGHPRLRFEFAAYLANYPRHWRLADEKARHPDFEARAWAIGQIVSARSALQLLAARATQQPWPEFAEYECAACHHDLKDQKRTFKGKPGALLWGTWYFAVLPALAEEAPGASQASSEARHELARLLEKRYPDPKTVSKAAQGEADRLTRWLRTVKTQGPARRGLPALLRALARHDELARSWDESAQLYLGIAAVHNGMTDVDPRLKSPARNAAILGLRKQLEKAFGAERDILYGTPGNFRPDAIKTSLSEIRKQLK